MKYGTIDDIMSEGFVGFKKVSDLFVKPPSAPNERGVYLVLYLGGDSPAFAVPGVGGYFKGKDPNVSLSDLESNWVQGSIVIYIGQAGGIRNGKWSDQTLQKRIKKYIKFGQGKNSAHYGGRLIWQMADYKDLVVCWKPLVGKITDPKELESTLISEFKAEYEKRPFANLQD
jgi:hypothetical protein